MFEGKKYKISQIFTIHPKTSKTSTEARDKTLSLNRQEKKMVIRTLQMLSIFNRWKMIK